MPSNKPNTVKARFQGLDAIWQGGPPERLQQLQLPCWGLLRPHSRKGHFSRATATQQT